MCLHKWKRGHPSWDSPFKCSHRITQSFEPSRLLSLKTLIEALRFSSMTPSLFGSEGSTRVPLALLNQLAELITSVAFTLKVAASITKGSTRSIFCFASTLDRYVNAAGARPDWKTVPSTTILYFSPARKIGRASCRERG